MLASAGIAYLTIDSLTISTTIVAKHSRGDDPKISQLRCELRPQFKFNSSIAITAIAQFNCIGVSQFYPQCNYGIAENPSTQGGEPAAAGAIPTTNLQGVRATPTTAGRATIAEAVFGVVAARQPIDVAGR